MNWKAIKQFFKESKVMYEHDEEEAILSNFSKSLVSHEGDPESAIVKLQGQIQARLPDALAHNKFLDAVAFRKEMKRTGKNIEAATERMKKITEYTEGLKKLLETQGGLFEVKERQQYLQELVALDTQLELEKKRAALAAERNKSEIENQKENIELEKRRIELEKEKVDLQRQKHQLLADKKKWEREISNEVKGKSKAEERLEEMKGIGEEIAAHFKGKLENFQELLDMRDKVLVDINAREKEEKISKERADMEREALTKIFQREMSKFV